MWQFLISIPGILCVIGLIFLILLRRIPRRSAKSKGFDSRQLMQILVSLVILGAGLYIILSNDYSPDVENWAFGIIGTVVGYWLPSSSSTASDQQELLSETV